MNTYLYDAGATSNVPGPNGDQCAGEERVPSPGRCVIWAGLLDGSRQGITMRRAGEREEGLEMITFLTPSPFGWFVTGSVRRAMVTWHIVVRR